MKLTVITILLVIMVLSLSSKTLQADTNEALASDEDTIAFREPIETRLASPWGALARIRQEDTLKLHLTLYPYPLSPQNIWHTWYSAVDPFGWVTVSTDSPLQKQSTNKGLSYHLGLEKMTYDPLVTQYHYRDGQVTVRVHNLQAITVTADSLSLQVQFDKSRFTQTNGLWTGSAKSNNGNIMHYGVVFKEEAKETEKSEGVISCYGLALIWADTKEQLLYIAEKVRNWNELNRETDRWITENTSMLKVKGPSAIVKQIEMEKRMFLGTQFVHGGIFAALDTWYERIWVRDGTNALLFPALAGHPNLLKKWTPYLLANPVPLKHNGHIYQTFITCPNGYGPVNKWEQDGAAYGVLSAYGYWKLLNDDSQLKSWYGTLTSAMEYLRASAFDRQLGLYYETYINEAPLKDAFGWEHEKLKELQVDGKWPIHICTNYINNLMYASHLMMGEMALHLNKIDESKIHFNQADILASAIDKHLWDEKNDWYHAGIAFLDDSTMKPVSWRYYNISIDYAWAEALFPTTSNPEKSFRSMNTIWKQQRVKENPVHSYFAPVWAHTAAFYAAAGIYGKTRECLDVITNEIPRTGFNDMMKARYAMSGAMVEIIGAAPYHHRPQTFTSGPFMQAAVNLGMIIDYSGITLVPTATYSDFRNVHYRDAIIDIDLTGTKTPNGIVVDGKAIGNTLKVPDALLTSSRHKISFLDSMGKNEQPVLQYTHLKLIDVKNESGYIEYHLQGYGVSAVRFNELVEKSDVTVANTAGEKLLFHFWTAEGGSRVQINAKGEILIRIKNKK